MVVDRVTDSRRIAQLLASELSGLETGPLAAVSVVDADRDASPSPDGTDAYAIEYRGDHVGEVSLYPDRVRLRLAGDAAFDADDPPVPIESTDKGLVVRVESGAAVKRAVDVVRTVLTQ